MEAIVSAVENLMKALGLDTTGVEMRDTPVRVAKMLKNELFKGLFTPAPTVTTFPSYGYNQMVVLGGVDVKSVCEHHLLSFVGKAHIGYVPKDKVVGVSKLNRIVDWYSCRPQIQERLTNQIADFIEKSLSPEGLIVVVECTHLCMLVRGVNQSGMLVTSAIKGCFENAATRSEFFSFIGDKRWKGERLF